MLPAKKCVSSKHCSQVVCVRVCVRVCVHSCVRACVRACETVILLYTRLTGILRIFRPERISKNQKRPVGKTCAPSSPDDAGSGLAACYGKEITRSVTRSTVPCAAPKKGIQRKREGPKTTRCRTAHKWYEDGSKIVYVRRCVRASMR